MDNRSFLVEATTISKYGRCFLFWRLGVSFNTILFFSHLFSVISPDNLSPYQGSLFHLNDFLSQSDYLSGVLVYFSQTNCRLVGGVELIQLRWQLLRLTWKEWLTAPFMVGISFYGRYFLLWSFHIRYKVMKSTCYFFSPLFLFHWCSQVVTNFTFIPETYVILLLLKCLPSNVTNKSLVKIGEHKLEENFSDVIWDAHLERFILLSVPISQQLSRLTSLYFSQMRVETWLHLSLTTVRWFWTIDHSWRLEIFALQVTSYKASFTQF